MGIVASHSTLMNTHWGSLVDTAPAERFKNGLAAAKEALAQAKLDSVVLIGPNHFRGLWLDLMPTFTIGLQECTTLGDGGTPNCALDVDTDLAKAICWDLVEAGFDPAFSLRLEVDHGIAHAVQYLLAGLDVPVVPFIINVFAPPLPSLSRCEAVGEQIRAAITADGAAKRVAVIASGGLSHQLPFPKWWEPRGSDEELLVEAWLNGRGRWKEYDARRRRITLGTKARINPDFDTQVMRWVEAGQMGQLTHWSSDDLERVGGNGAQEVRTWLAAAAVAAHAPGRQLAYEPIAEWLTGMGVAIIGGPGSIEPGLVFSTDNFHTATPGESK